MVLLLYPFLMFSLGLFKRYPGKRILPRSPAYVVESHAKPSTGHLCTLQLQGFTFRMTEVPPTPSTFPLLRQEERGTNQHSISYSSRPKNYDLDLPAAMTNSSEA
ncbi:unnamed protein product [Lactuca virosa]|uniref:Uncharacterized protein n=1 Tax=Lactuca virosa TaxID=75947 RepID=A0AAU9NVS5_9ASTR|nr:unnamed protein product [Lactuca virosa]